MDKQEFTRRVLAVEGRLYRISCGMLREPQDRLDAVQEAVLKAWQSLDRLRREEYFETWLTRILINECHNIQNARRRSAPMDELPECAAPPEDGNRALRDALASLDEELRLPLLLHHMEGYSLQEVANMLHISVAAARGRVYQARQKLRQQLDKEEQQP